MLTVVVNRILYRREFMFRDPHGWKYIREHYIGGLAVIYCKLNKKENVCVM